MMALQNTLLDSVEDYPWVDCSCTSRSCCSGAGKNKSGQALQPLNLDFQLHTNFAFDAIFAKHNRRSITLNRVPGRGDGSNYNDAPLNGSCTTKFGTCLKHNLGAHRYPAAWTGDIGDDPIKLANSISLFPAACTGHLWCAFSVDLGPYTDSLPATHPINAARYIRFVQWGVFSSMYRPHDGGNADTRIWTFADEHYKILRDFTRLRGAITPWVYALARRLRDEALPFSRPMWWDWSAQAAAVGLDSHSDAMKKQYMFGDHVLVRPVDTFISPADAVPPFAPPRENRTVTAVNASAYTAWLPPGEWLSFNGTESYDLVDPLRAVAALDEVPVFVKPGAVLPMWPPGRRSAPPVQRTRLWACFVSSRKPTAGNGSDWEDDGDTLSLAGTSTTLSFMASSSEFTANVSAARGNYPGAAARKTHALQLRGRTFSTGTPSVACDGKAVARGTEGDYAGAGWWRVAAATQEMATGAAGTLVVVCPPVPRGKSLRVSVRLAVPSRLKIDEGAVVHKEGECDVTAFGAVGDNVTHDTAAVAKAIAHCRETYPAGAVVRFPAPGKYLIGQTNLTSNMTLFVEGGATIVGSPRKQDYPRGVPVYGRDPEYKPLIYSENTVNVKILGSNGTIDGNGWAGGWYYQRWNLSGWKKGPMLIGMHRVHGLEIANVTLRDGARWHVHPVWCTNVRVHDLHVFAPKHHDGHPLGGNDGIDPDSSRDVEISNVWIDTGDDAISIKSVGPEPCTNVLIRNATLISRNFAVGSHTTGGISNILLEDSRIGNDEGSSAWAIKFKVQGTGAIENITLRRLRLGSIMAKSYYKGSGGFALQMSGDGMRNISITDVVAKSVVAAGSLAGSATSSLVGLTLSNISLTCEGAKPCRRFGCKYVDVNSSNFAGLSAALRPKCHTDDETTSASPLPKYFGDAECLSLNILDVNLTACQAACDASDAPRCTAVNWGADPSGKTQGCVLNRLRSAWLHEPGQLPALDLAVSLRYPRLLRRSAVQRQRTRAAAAAAHRSGRRVLRDQRLYRGRGPSGGGVAAARPAAGPLLGEVVVTCPGGSSTAYALAVDAIVVNRSRTHAAVAFNASCGAGAYRLRILPGSLVPLPSPCGAAAKWPSGMNGGCCSPGSNNTLRGYRQGVTLNGARAGFAAAVAAGGGVAAVVGPKTATSAYFAGSTEMEEVAAMRANASADDLLLFPEDAEHEVRMLEHVPLRWVQRRLRSSLQLQALPNQCSPFSVSIFALAAATNISVAFKSGGIDAAAFRCTSCGGGDHHGQPFTKHAPADRVLPLWLGLILPSDAKAGALSGSIAVSYRLSPTSIFDERK